MRLASRRLVKLPWGDWVDPDEVSFVESMGDWVRVVLRTGPALVKRGLTLSESLQMADEAAATINGGDHD